MAVVILHVHKYEEGLHEKHVVTTWELGNHLSIRLKTQGNQEKPVSRWPIAGPSEYWLLASSSASKVKQQYTHNITNAHKITTMRTIQIQLTKMDIRKTTLGEESTVYSSWIFFPTRIAHTLLPQIFTSHHFTNHIHPSHFAPLLPLSYIALHFPSLYFTALQF